MNSRKFSEFGHEQLNGVLITELENVEGWSGLAEKMNELHKLPKLPSQQHFRWEKWASEKLSDLWRVTVKDNKDQIGSSDILITSLKFFPYATFAEKMFPAFWEVIITGDLG